MNDQEKIIALAEMDGFDSEQLHPASGYIKYTMERWNWLIQLNRNPLLSSEREGFILADLPNYLHSYDAILPLIRKTCTIETRELNWKFNRAMADIFFPDNKECADYWATQPVLSMIATPLQLCDALLIAAGKMLP